MQGVFKDLCYSDRHDGPEPIITDGYHIEVIPAYRTLYFTRPLTDEEKAEINGWDNLIRHALTP